MHSLFASLNERQVRHMDAVVRRENQEWLDGRVMAALRRRNLVRRNVFSDGWIVTWGVDEAWEQWRK